jgi:hypothetical protein
MDSRGTTLLPVKQALMGTAIGVYPAMITGGFRFSYSHEAFRSQLREDFRPFPLTRLTLIPGSLSAVWGLLVPILANRFQDGLNYNSMTLLPQG